MTPSGKARAPADAMIRRCRGAVLACATMASSLASAEPGFAIGLGVTDEIEGERTEVVSVSWLGHSRHPWEFSAGRLGPRDDLEREPLPATVFVAVSKRLTWRRWFVSGGIAVTDQDNDILSGHAQFYSGAGYSTGTWTASLRHLSNGDTGGRNRGESFALVEYRF